MKIEIDSKPNKNYYDEHLYVVNYYKSIKKKPQKKVHRMTRLLLGYEVFALLYIALLCFACKGNFSTFTYVALTGLVIVALTVILLLGRVVKGLNDLMKENLQKTIEITKDEVSYLDENKKVSIKWDNVEFVVINKYSTAFFSKDATNLIISVSMDYKTQVLQGIEEAGRMDLVVDNSGKY